MQKEQEKIFFRKYAEFIVSIIEDKPFIEINLTMYKVLIFLSYFQIGAYLFQDSNGKTIEDLKIKSLTQIIRLISFKEVLIIQDRYIISIIYLVISQLFLYFFIIYAGISVVLKTHFLASYEQFKLYFKQMNQILNMYLCLFISIFLNYQIELATSITFCSSKSLFSQDRIQSGQVCTLPNWQIAIGIAGLIMSTLTAGICLYFSRSFEFQEQNLMKRKLSTILIITTILKMIITFFEHTSIETQNKLLGKNILVQIYGLINLFDSSYNTSYQNQELCQFNVKVASIFQSLVSIFCVWNYTNLINDNEIFYFALIIVIVITAFFQSVHTYIYEKRIQVDIYQELQSNNKTIFGLFPFDSYINEFILLGQQSLKDNLCKYNIQRILSIHIQSCKQEQCYCQSLKVKNLQAQDHQNHLSTEPALKKISFMTDDGKDIDIEVVYRIADSLYSWLLQQKLIKDNQSQYEHLSLQYITFMIKCLKNHTRANYELKVLVQRKSQRSGTFSLFFQVISSLLSENLEKVIGQMNEKFISSQRREQLTIKHITITDNLCYEFMPAFNEVIMMKQKMWTKLQNGFPDMNAFRIEALKLMGQVNKVRLDYMKKLRLVQNERDFNYCLAIKKLSLLFHLFILNDSTTAGYLEDEVIELRKRDAFAEDDCLNNENLVKKNIVTLTISITQNIGKLMSQKDNKTAEFFQYSNQELDKIQKINELMPPFIAKNHDQFITSFIQRGTSKYIKSSIFTFCRNYRGYIIPIKLHTDFSFIQLNDFYISGTILKVNKNSNYLLFDRAGRILGLSEQLAYKLLVESNIMSHLPIAEQILARLNAFTLIPKIIKNLQNKQKEILSNYKKESYEIVHSDQQGQFSFDTKLMNEANEFENFINKTTLKNNMQPNKKNIKQQNKQIIDSLDVFEKESFSQYKAYKIYKKKKDELNKQQKNSLKNKSEKTINCSKKQINSPSQKTGTTFFQSKKELKTAKSIQVKEQYKLQFQYILSYHTLPAAQKQQDTSKSYDQTQDDEGQRTIFFSLQMNDISLLQNHKQVISEKNNTFKEQIASFMGNISCIPALEKLFQPILSSQRSVEQENEIKQGKKQKKRALSINKIFPIPKSFLKYLVPNNIIQQTNENQIKTENKRKTKKQFEKNRTDMKILYKRNNLAINNKTSLSSLNYSCDDDEEQSSSESEANSFGEDIFTNRINKSKNLALQQDVSEKFVDCCNSKLDDIFDRYEITATDLLSIDSYYKAKRVILEKTQSTTFISVLQTEIANALLEIREEKELLSNLYYNQDIQNDQINIIYQSGDNNNKFESGVENQITFRNYHSPQKEFLKQKSSPQKLQQTFNQQNTDDYQIHIQNESKQKFSSLLEIPDSRNYTQPTTRHQQQAEQAESQTKDQQLPTSSQYDLNNTSFRPSHINISYDNLTSHHLNNNQGSTYFSASARPLFIKPLDINNELNNEVLVTPSSVDGDELASQRNQICIQRELSTTLAQSQSNTMRKTASKKYSFIQTSTLEKNPQHIAMWNNDETGKIPIAQIKIDNLFNQSSANQKQLTKLNHNQLCSDSNTQNQQNQNKTQRSEVTHEKVINTLLNQSGLIEGKGEKISIHSSSKSSVSNGGYFLKEIIKKSKIPYGAKSYSSFLIIFSILFIGLNFANLIIIKTDMEYFTANVVVLRYPRRLLRDYAKTIYGKYLSIQLELKYFQDSINEEYKKLSDQYLSEGYSGFNTMIQGQQDTLTEYALKLQQSNGIYNQEYQYYQDFKLYQENQNTALTFKNPLFFIGEVQHNQSTTSQASSYMTLRANFFQFGNDILDFVDFLVENVITTADNLILKFTFICLAAIFSVIIIPVLAIPAVRKINIYEEKILMIVSRINYDHSAVERQKLQICSQLLNLENYEWLKYSFHEVFSLKYDQFDISVVNYNHNQQQLQSTNKNQEYIQQKKNKIIISQKALQQKKSLSSKKQGTQGQTIKQQLKFQNKNVISKISQKVQKKNESNSIRQVGNNYNLQSKIFNQKLSIFQRIKFLLLFMALCTVYFLVVIIYLNTNTELLKTPVNINKQTNLIHIHSTNYILSSELLAFDGYVKQMWPRYDMNDLPYFESTMQQSISQINYYQNSLTNIIYGSNPYTPDIVTMMKNIMEGQVCSYLVNNKCSGDVNQSIPFGIKEAVSQFDKIQTSFPQVLSANTSQKADLIQYLNSDERISIFVKGFQTQDEVFDIFSSTANTGIGTVSQSIQDFMEQYLLICGIILAISMVVVFIYTWKTLYYNIQLMNLFLTFIPEEKLFEEVTMYMLKTLIRM